MKVLTKLLLIHWHYFQYELIEFGQLNFLTGKTATGKSTIIDAMQLVLLGDTSGTYFNKAANSRSDRTLRGYLLGELGDDEQSGFRYLRTGRFNSYIAMEFHDTDRDRFFTAGCCFDVYSESDNKRLFFLYDGEIHPDGFLQGNTPMDIAALRVYLREQYAGHSETTDVGRDFRTKLYGRLGGLRDRFSGLLKKAVSFNPDAKIQEFITDFVCDSQQPVDVGPMQDNIRSYKRLEQEATVLQSRIALLERIVKTHDSFQEARGSEHLYSYLVDRAQFGMKEEELLRALASSEDLAEQLNQLVLDLDGIARRLSELRGQRDTLNAELLSNGEAQALEAIERQIAEKQQQIQMITDNYERALNVLTVRGANWRGATEAMLQKVQDPRIGLLQAGLVSRIRDIEGEGQKLLKQIAPLSGIKPRAITQLGADGLGERARQADALRTHAIELGARLREEKETLLHRREELQLERQSLESGIYRFPQDALDLKEALLSRLRSVTGQEDVDVRIVAEMAEIPDDRWRNVIEGYLNTQKFYILVPTDCFRESLRVFNAIKHEKTIYGTGLVDVEKMREKATTPVKGSLAEELQTEDADVRLFLDYTLGSVRKCNAAKDLRNYHTAVTDDGLLYRNYAVRAMNPQRWSKPAIGQKAIKRRLETVLRELAELSDQVSVCAGIVMGLQEVGSQQQLNLTEIEQVVDWARRVAEIPVLEEDLVSLNKNRQAIDTTAIDQLRARISILDSDIAESDRQQREQTATQGQLVERRKVLVEQTIPELRIQLQKYQEDIASLYDKEWIQATGDPRYERELTARGSADSIFIAFPREQSRARNAKEAAWEQLVELRRHYNDAYKMGHDIRALHNEVYAETWRELSDIQLPEYQSKISDAKAKAFEQFQEDFISRLQNNITTARQQIEELNNAIKGAAFGEDTYRFRIIPRPDYKRYYDMIVDPMITQGGYNLLSMSFNDKYREEIADLFGIITNEEGAADSSEYERRVHEFTDFRTYLTFDLEVIGHDGEAQRLSKTMGKKSGGETQTPFYIAVLASFAQLYRAGRDKTFTTCRLIIFDEAFSKMDGERIGQSIQLLRQFNFQVILSAPPEKIGDIATLVDTNLCVLREGKLACVRAFDPKHPEEIING